MHVFRSSHFLTTFLLCSSVLASVVVQYPLEDQLPLIARINTPYNWTVSNRTFASSRNESLDYLASDLPGWLTWDNLTRSFQGTPSEADEGSRQIRLTATEGSSGDVASSSFALLVTSAPATKVARPVVAQFKLPNPFSIIGLSGISELCAQGCSTRSSNSAKVVLQHRVSVRHLHVGSREYVLCRFTK